MFFLSFVSRHRPRGTLQFLVAAALTGLVLPHATLAIAKARTPAASQSESASEKGQQQARRALMAGVNSWAIQLRFIDRTALAASPYDLVVIDHAPHPKKDIEIPFTPDQIAPLKLKPDGTRRLVLAYMSMGEAERYRFYWKGEWDQPETRPKWLGAENPRWPGDYRVQFADPEWQSVIFGTPDSFLDRILAAGFDGVFLDRVDAFQDEGTGPGADDAMTGFVQRLADHAHRINPEFLVVMQNAEELVKSKSLLARIDAVAKEDLQFGADNGEGANPPQMVLDTVNNLRRARRAGLRVLVLEYARSPEAIAATQRLAQREGHVLHITDRMLGVLSPIVPQPASSAGDPLTSAPR